MTKFICKECGYKTDNASLEICPYCSKKSIKKEQDAEELIKEVEEILE
jgi:rubrerythrin